MIAQTNIQNTFAVPAPSLAQPEIEGSCEPVALSTLATDPAEVPPYGIAGDLGETSSSLPVDVLLGALWRSPSLSHQIGMRDSATGRFRNIPVADVMAACQRGQEWSSGGGESYFACSEYRTADNRKADNVVGAWAFWMDVDCGQEKEAAGKGYGDTTMANAALVAFCGTVALPSPTHIVDSGGGLHVYWALDSLIDADEWLAHALKLKELAEKLGLLADPTRTADIASVLRIPGTLNYKYTPARAVNLKQASLPLEHGVVLQAIVDAHDRHCATEVRPKSSVAAPELAAVHVQDHALAGSDALKRTLAYIDSDVGYEGWLRVLMAIFHETQGSESGLSLAIEWSSKGSKFKGPEEIESKWRSFRLDVARPITVGTLIQMAGEAGADTGILRLALELEGDAPDEVVVARCETESIQLPAANRLMRYSLLGRTADVERQMVEAVAVLGSIALLGQATVLYASPNTGKTLIVLHLIIDGIKRGVINPANLFYINMDDNSTGLVAKLHIAEEYGFHMLAAGYRSFEAKVFAASMQEMVDTNTASGVIVGLDTLKKFVDIMSKGGTSEFTQLVRQFVLKGGTVIALAHTNKNPGLDGKPVYGGTSDIVDDFDCAWTIARVPQQPDAALRVVEFNNIKRRGNVAQTAAYSYSLEPAQTYTALLLSVSEVDQSELTPMKEAAALVSDADLIEVISACIREGISTKMELARSAAGRSKASKNAALGVIEKYTGDDPIRHRWNYKVRARGAKVFALHEPAGAGGGQEARFQVPGGGPVSQGAQPAPHLPVANSAQGPTIH